MLPHPQPHPVLLTVRRALDLVGPTTILGDERCEYFFPLLVDLTPVSQLILQTRITERPLPVLIDLRVLDVPLATLAADHIPQPLHLGDELDYMLGIHTPFNSDKWFISRFQSF
jgi:hypothetical protein